MTNHHSMNASIPQHLYGYVSKEILYGLDPEKKKMYEPCVIFGVTSIPSRSLHFSILCESGAQWARIPLHMLRWQKPTCDIERDLSDLQCWDCHGWDFSVHQYEYLREMGCTFRTSNGTNVPARYWFTLDHTDNGWSQFPSEHKCYHVILCMDGSGQIAAMPNNRILWKDASFVKQNSHPLDYRTMHETTWHAEDGKLNPQQTAITQD